MGERCINPFVKSLTAKRDYDVRTVLETSSTRRRVSPQKRQNDPVSIMSIIW